MNNFFKIHKVKILRGNGNFKFLGNLIRLPLPNLTKWFDEVNLFTSLCCVKRISAQVGLRIPPSNQHL